MNEITSAITNITKEAGGLTKGITDNLNGETSKVFSTGCDTNVAVGEVGAKLKEVTSSIQSSLSSGVAGSIGSLKSKLETGVGDLKKKVEGNLFGDIPKVDVNLQESFKGALDSLQKGNISGGITALQTLNRQFPTANVAGLLQKSAGLIPGVSLPPNATQLIQGDLAKAQVNISSALPKIQQSITGALGGATAALGTTNVKLNEVLNLTNNASDLSSKFQSVLTTPGAGTVNDLKNIAGNLTSTLQAAGSKVSEIGGSFSINENTSIGGLLNSAKGFADKLLPGVNLGEQKLPPFNICQTVPNLQLQNGSDKPVEEAKPPPAPVVDAVKPESPAPTPKPLVPVDENPFKTPTNIVSKDDFLNAIQDLIDAKTRQQVYDLQTIKFVVWGKKAGFDQADFLGDKRRETARMIEEQILSGKRPTPDLTQEMEKVKQSVEYRSYQKLYSLCLGYATVCKQLIDNSKTVESFETYYNEDTGPNSGGGVKKRLAEAKEKLNAKYQ